MSKSIFHFHLDSTRNAFQRNLTGHYQRHNHRQHTEKQPGREHSTTLFSESDHRLGKTFRKELFITRFRCWTIQLVYQLNRSVLVFTFISRCAQDARRAMHVSEKEWTRSALHRNPMEIVAIGMHFVGVDRSLRVQRHIERSDKKTSTQIFKRKEWRVSCERSTTPPANSLIATTIQLVGINNRIETGKFHRAIPHGACDR